uniref:Uncharacterized protein n=1 Tax=viral metagenome TaxID=1070528 RepID=A0A6C0DFS8_9ZZZZ
MNAYIPIGIAGGGVILFIVGVILLAAHPSNYDWDELKIEVNPIITSVFLGGCFMTAATIMYFITFTDPMPSLYFSIILNIITMLLIIGSYGVSKMTR